MDAASWGLLMVNINAKVARYGNHSPSFRCVTCFFASQLRSFGGFREELGEQEPFRGAHFEPDLELRYVQHDDGEIPVLAHRLRPGREPP